MLWVTDMRAVLPQENRMPMVSSRRMGNFFISRAATGLKKPASRVHREVWRANAPRPTPKAAATGE